MLHSDYDHGHHPEPPWVPEFRGTLARIEKIMADEKASIDTLTADVAADTDAENAAITLLGNLKAELDAAIASAGQDNNAALQALSASLEANKAALAAAVTANTPAS